MIAGERTSEKLKDKGERSTMEIPVLQTRHGLVESGSGCWTGSRLCPESHGIFDGCGFPRGVQGEFCIPHAP